ncbi:hypothetical protein NM688_g82 [Phlebia brevispora]|uniref:Uncharacterized protein n=1 Tax=Phlebia brevispora TaxID=194682 RepID=A0ACC1TFD3_9APHY|nr:hypothetical protein NM688_g82 [Phlebia brevispora]
MSARGSNCPQKSSRTIATHYLVVTGEIAYTPDTWTSKDMWASRLLYTAIRDANEIEKLMSVCPSWELARECQFYLRIVTPAPLCLALALRVEHHSFWQYACAAIDPHDLLGPHAFIRPPSTAGSIQAPVRVPPYRHFRNIANYSCLVCRVNLPMTNQGIGAGKRAVHTPHLSTISTCKDHRKGTYCSLCLRAAPVDDTRTMVYCVENEDEETWPRAEATCRSCRDEWLVRRAMSNPYDREAFPGESYEWRDTVDWEVRQAIDTFVEMGEGCISDVLTLAREKHWLRNNTKLAELLSQALASSRYTARAEGGYDAVGGSEDDLSDNDEDDPELMSLTEDAGGIRELAITDWARNRILDGYWVSPADQWCNHVIPGQPITPAVHPCPWIGATYSGALVDGESAGDGSELEHPRPRTYKTPCPPTYALCELVNRTFMRVLRDILLPAMSNIVRRLMIECTADGTDPAQRALKMSLDDVIAELRDYATWTRGVDWLELRAARLKEERSRRTGSEEDDASLSSRSDGSHTTSPVLSTTTLQTTPSPPPCVKEDETVESPTAAPAATLTTPMSPPLHTKELLRPVPYVPVSIAELPQCSYEYLRSIWRDACSPLYNCRCSICERAMLKVNMEAGRMSSDNQEVPVQVQKPVQIRIEDPAIIALREEEEEDYADIEFDDEENLTTTPETMPTWETKPDTKGVQDSPQRTRKRSHDEPPDDDMLALLGMQRKVDGAATPPKKQRTEGSFTPSSSPSKESLVSSPMRARKRSSEELEDEQVPISAQNGKRVKASHDVDVEA